MERWQVSVQTISFLAVPCVRSTRRAGSSRGGGREGSELGSGTETPMKRWPLAATVGAKADGGSAGLWQPQ